MKESKFYNPIICKTEWEIRIERDDIEQALSWFDRISHTQINNRDIEVYRDLRKLVSHMRSINVYGRLLEICKKKFAKLEDAYKADFETEKELIFSGAQTHASILRCEANLKSLEERMNILHLENHNLKHMLGELQQEVESRQPYKCPVCDSTGTIQLDEEELIRYNKTRMRNAVDGSWFIWCIACEGKGILWD